ncbi:uncharacterized protein N0V89_011364 [Didymosphaeria variabile]|uniref:Wax synthase domain-containing protein n=1 Tax=Didymosphaeria variabile TaxID=1932322 RepID=A0A9W8XB04_9PLEO|nr:uncharacterized protein N0V89_011364 [Didymosphaeria variabile]KAJ4345235.1 hypothetical protein N0V89_011364 [Didymosphaeria variabile]
MMTSYWAPVVPVLEDDLIHQLLVDGPPAIVALLVPGVAMYASLYALARGWVGVSRVVVVPTLLLFWASIVVAPVRCLALRGVFDFGIVIGVMKLVEIHILCWKKALPTYTNGRPPRPSIMALLLLTELRYESFTPNPIRLAPIPQYPFPSSPKKRQIFYSEHVQILIHIAIFIALQSLPQYAPVKAFGVLLSIWIIFTGCQLLLRYKNSPPLFGPIFLADSLATFWTETWHNAFASPCLTLAYNPTMWVLTTVGVPRRVARSFAVIASFSLMAVFHAEVMSPLLPPEGKMRIGLFFVLNGVFTVIEVAVWGKKRDWRRALMAWIIELALASWAVQTAQVADGLLHADWRGLCRPKI